MKVEFCICMLLAALTCCAGFNNESQLSQLRQLSQVEEARGKAKFALLIHFFYVVATKLFVLKIIYGALFYALVLKAWKFVLWFIHYLKEKKHEHHEYVEYDHDHHGNDHYGHDHYGHDHHDQDHYGHDHYGHSQYRPDNGPGSYESTGYASDNYGPYAFEKHGLVGGYKKAYDADGSFSIKS